MWPKSAFPRSAKSAYYRSASSDSDNKGFLTWDMQCTNHSFRLAYEST